MYAAAEAHSAKLFTNGNSQALRLPKAFRFQGVKEVSIERKGDGLLVRPLARPSIKSVLALVDQFEDFPEVAEIDVPDRAIEF